MATMTFRFVCLPDAAIWQPCLSSHAKALFAALLSYRSRKTGLCNPRLNKLAERLGASLSTIRRALDQLRRAGMVIVYRTLFGNRYEIATPDRWGTTISATECAVTGERSAAFTDERTQRSRMSAQEPDVLNHMGDEPDADAASVCTPCEEAAAAATTFVEMQPEKPTPRAAREIAVREAAEQIVVELMAEHPQPGNLPGAIAAAERILASKPDQIEATVEAMRSSHAAWRLEWPSRRFIPMLPKWFADGDWRNPPVKRKDVKSETWLERRDREKREYDEKFYRELAEDGEWDVIRQYGGEHAVEVWREKIKAIA
jgi:DNA-binding transcriptional ArsR family regulator